MRARMATVALAATAVLLAGCGGGGGGVSKDPVTQVSTGGGLREKVRAAQAVTAADFPAAGGRTLQEVANTVGSPAPSSAWRARCSRRARTGWRSA